MSITEPGGGDNAFALQRFLVEDIDTDVVQLSPTSDFKVDAKDSEGGTTPDSSDSEGGNHVASRSLLCMATDLSCQADFNRNCQDGRSNTAKKKYIIQATQSSADIANSLDQLQPQTAELAPDLQWHHLANTYHCVCVANLLQQKPQKRSAKESVYDVASACPASQASQAPGWPMHIDHLQEVPTAPYPQTHPHQQEF